ncbi:MAG: flagellar protein [Firmicutes bacterium]|nr:flagellar protein [Bacillota bacterium]
MDDYKLNINRTMIPIVKPKTPVRTPDKPKASKGISFDEVLDKVISKEQNVKFSKHAQERLEKRNIEFTTQDIKNINNAVEKAAQKGLKDTLIIMGNTALIANVRNKTVITATTDESLRDKIFTNIDGAIII